jgi:hypothetical protein
VEITLLLLIAIGLYWYSTMKARERGLVIAKQFCTQMQMQLIDDTVYLSSLGIKRDSQGQLQIRRIYTFRYLDFENQIHQGTLILLGQRQESILLDS